LRYNIETAQLMERGRGLSISKPQETGGAKKIDGVISLIMALAGMIDAAPGTGSMYVL
jgi:hypothetical protein